MNAAGLGADAVPSLPGIGDVDYAAGMTVKDEDAALMLRYAAGDARAFDLLYQRHKDPLYRYLLRHAHQPDAAADLFQDVWSKVIKARDRYQPTARFTTWLYRIAHNAFIDRVRREKRYGDSGDFDPDSRAGSDAGPDQRTEHALMRRRLLAALDALPVEQKDAFLLHEEAGLGVEEIAVATGVARETAKSRLRYANTKLRAALAEPARAAEKHDD